LSDDKRAAYATCMNAWWWFTDDFTGSAFLRGLVVSQSHCRFQKHPESAHLTDLPLPAHELLDEALLRRMDYAQHIVRWYCRSVKKKN
jgi:hypothetical protein